MAADEKHAATYHGGEYTPSTERVRISWVRDSVNAFKGERSQAEAQFTRWLDRVHAEAKREALEEAAGAYPTMLRDMVSRPSVARWLEERAEQYKEQS